MTSASWRPAFVTPRCRRRPMPGRVQILASPVGRPASAHRLRDLRRADPHLGPGLRSPPGHRMRLARGARMKHALRYRGSRAVAGLHVGCPRSPSDLARARPDLASTSRTPASSPATVPQPLAATVGARELGCGPVLTQQGCRGATQRCAKPSSVWTSTRCTWEPNAAMTASGEFQAKVTPNSGSRRWAPASSSCSRSRPGARVRLGGDRLPFKARSEPNWPRDAAQATAESASTHSRSRRSWPGSASAISADQLLLQRQGQLRIPGSVYSRCADDRAIRN